jgi:Na+-driven multidrug efflux pump
MKYAFLSIVLCYIFIWFFNSYLDWGIYGSLLGAGFGSGIVIFIMDEKIKALEKQNKEKVPS